MSVNSVDSRNNSNTGLITAGSAIVGGGSGALIGYYSKPWVKDGAPTDTFIKKAGEKLLSETTSIPQEQKELLRNAQSMIDKMKNAKTVEEFRNANLEPVNKLIDSYSDLDTLKTAWANGCEIADNFRFDKVNIDEFNEKFANVSSIDEYKRVLAEAVDAEINAKGLDKCKQEFLSFVDNMRKNGMPVTLDDSVKMIFKEVYDSDAKKLVKAEDVTDEAFNIFKDVAKKMQGKSAAIWGAVGAAALGIGGFIAANAFGKKESAQKEVKEINTQA